MIRASVVFAIQSWLGEGKESTKSSGQPAIFSVGMSSKQTRLNFWLLDADLVATVMALAVVCGGREMESGLELTSVIDLPALVLTSTTYSWSSNTATCSVRSTGCVGDKVSIGKESMYSKARYQWGWHNIMRGLSLAEEPSAAQRGNASLSGWHVLEGEMDYDELSSSARCLRSRNLVLVSTLSPFSFSLVRS
jgi:hypothetical protein